MSDFLKMFEKQTKIFAVITVACLVVAIIMSATAIKFYTQKKISVNATVTSIEEYDNSTDETTNYGYRIYCKYHCLGKAYTDILCDDTTNADEYKVGDKINIDVYAKSPGEVANNTSINGFVFFAFFAIFLVITLKKGRDDYQLAKYRKNQEKLASAD